MSLNPNRPFDKTSLSLDAAEDRGFIHRDYIAHVFRWSHVVKRLQQKGNYKTADILDIGCGKETPLIKTLYTSKMTPRSYMGVEMNKVPHQEIHDKIRNKCQYFELYDDSNYLDLVMNQTEMVDKPNWVTCFEVFEHMIPEHAIQLLIKIKHDMDPNGQLFISTPNWDRRSCAANHINEIDHLALGALFEQIGFTVKAAYGTFASQRDYVDELIETHGCADLFDLLHQYYDSNVLSVIFAPAFPRTARNCIWELSPIRGDDEPQQYPLLGEVDTPWSSSETWQDYEDTQDWEEAYVNQGFKW